MQYFALLLLIFAAEIVLGVVAWTQVEKIPDAAADVWHGLPMDGRRSIQKSLQCCGFSSVSEDLSCAMQVGVQPCRSLLVSLLQSGMRGIGIAALVLGALQFVLLVTACFLSGSFSEQRTERRKQELSKVKRTQVRPPLPKV